MGHFFTVETQHGTGINALAGGQKIDQNARTAAFLPVDITRAWQVSNALNAERVAGLNHQPLRPLNTAQQHNASLREVPPNVCQIVLSAFLIQ